MVIGTVVGSGSGSGSGSSTMFVVVRECQVKDNRRHYFADENKASKK